MHIHYSILFIVLPFGEIPHLPINYQKLVPRPKSERKTALTSFCILKRTTFATVYSLYPPMLLLATTLALSFLGSLVNAQSSTSDIALDIVAIQAHFTNAELVPELLTTFNPDAVLNVTFHSNLTITPGQNLTTERESPILFLFFFFFSARKTLDGLTGLI